MHRDAVRYWLDFIQALEGSDEEKVQEFELALSNITRARNMARSPDIQLLFSTHGINIQNGIWKTSNLDLTALTSALRSSLEKFDGIDIILESNLCKTSRLERCHINPIVVQFVIEKCFSGPEYELANCKFPSDPRFGSRRVVCSAPRQSNYHFQVFALAWIAHHVHGVATCLFLPDFLELATFQMRKNEFNSYVTGHIQKGLEDSLSPLRGSAVIPAHYLLHISTSDREISESDIYMPIEGKWKRTRPAIRLFKCPDTDNEYKRCSSEIQYVVKAYGISVKGSVNVMIILDETRKHFKKRIDNTISSSIKLGAKSFFEELRLEKMLISIPAIQFVSLFVEITSLPLDRLSLEKIQTVQCRPPALYWSLANGDSDDFLTRRIQVTSFQELDYLRDLESISDHSLLCTQACERIFHNDTEGFHHVAIYHRLKTNESMEFIARTMVSVASERQGGLHDAQRPVVVLCCHSHTENGFGISIHFNRFAETHVKPLFYIAEKEVIADAEDWSALAGFEGLECPHGRNPVTAESILVPGCVGGRIFHRKSMNTGLVNGVHYSANDTSPVLHLPARRAYGIPTALSILEAACCHAKIQVAGLFIVTISKQQLRHGLAISSLSGKLRPTVLLCPRVADGEGLDGNFLPTFLALCSICGAREPNDESGVCPLIIAHARDVERIEEVIAHGETRMAEEFMRELKVDKSPSVLCPSRTRSGLVPSSFDLCENCINGGSDVSLKDIENDSVVNSGNEFRHRTSYLDEDVQLILENTGLLVLGGQHRSSGPHSRVVAVDTVPDIPSPDGIGFATAADRVRATVRVEPQGFSAMTRRRKRVAQAESDDDEGSTQADFGQAVATPKLQADGDDDQASTPSALCPVGARSQFTTKMQRSSRRRRRLVDDDDGGGCGNPDSTLPVDRECRRRLDSEFALICESARVEKAILEPDVKRRREALLG